jgi:CheY-like chemotaxis protein
MGGMMWVESGGYMYVPTRAFEQSEPVSGEGEITTCMMRSAFESGSTFYFTIAADACQPTPQSENRSRVQPLLAGQTALVVDDNPTTLQQISVQLQAWGMIPRSMRTAQAARQCLEEGDSFHVAIWDGQIPSDSDRDKAMAYLSQKQVPVILLTDLWQTRETETSQSGLVRACINKPVKQSQLYNVLMEVCAGVSPDEPQVYNSSVPINSEMAEILPLRILLAEDHPVNLKVAVQMLGRLGYRIDTAENGKQVLESLKRQPYDVVFMDVQMPEMDGLETTRRICELWSSGSRPRIIAMTANAMQGDREECMASGMDDYISKPIRMNELVQALRRCEPRRHGQVIVDNSDNLQTKQKSTNQPFTTPGNEPEKLPPASSDGSQQFQKPETESNSTPLDGETLQALKEIDALQEVIDIYLDSAPQLLQRIQEAVRTEQPEELREAAHSLKSTSAALGAFDLSEMAKKMEVMGRFGNTASASNMLADIEAEYQRVRKALDEENSK